jgi:hypothetical protein
VTSEDHLDKLQAEYEDRLDRMQRDYEDRLDAAARREREVREALERADSLLDYVRPILGEAYGERLAVHGLNFETAVGDACDLIDTRERFPTVEAEPSVAELLQIAGDELVREIDEALTRLGEPLPSDSQPPQADDDEYREPCPNGCLGHLGEGTSGQPVPMYCGQHGCDVESPGMSYKPDDQPPQTTCNHVNCSGVADESCECPCHDGPASKTAALRINQPAPPTARAEAGGE